MESDAAYFRRRASEEYLAADKAGPPRALQIHLELAARYEDLARAIEADERLLGIDAERAAEREADADPRPLKRETMWI